MLSYKWCICTLSIFALFSSITAAGKHRTPSHIVVDPSGKHGFRSIQAAVNSVPSKNRRWTTIDIKQGVYREQVVIPYDKPFIYLKGAGRKKTFIVWNGHGPINETATFVAQADNILARGITFTNSYNYPPERTRNPVEPAVAALVQGDKSAFYRCRFFGVQDTLWDAYGRHLYRSCTIQGAVDFIFGSAQSIYESCTISAVAAALNGKTGYITSQGKNHPQDTSGFIFKNCNIVGNGKFFLGRPWRDYARVLFYNTAMADIIEPLGWDAWSRTGYESTLMMAEYNCRGPGANTSGRVKWEPKLQVMEANRLTDISFIDDQGWVKKAFKIMGRR
ncbi:probable pectinesterase 29 [Salvia hispanica]|uniref:probable pectinesterase 29 n=1 Tax=Salvia hispanica TaxID=49212 RepID=UPI0020090952|nr:probable pectinesterase 29 [Salvia hispanica]